VAAGQIKRGVETPASFGKARTAAGRKLEDIIAALAGAVEGPFALQHLRIFRILMSAMRTDQHNTRVRRSLQDIVAVRHRLSQRRSVTAADRAYGGAISNRGILSEAIKRTLRSSVIAAGAAEF
jgi:hypothetical protein